MAASVICGGLVEKARPRRLAEFCRDAVDFTGRKKSSLISVDDKEWPEVRTINSYAIFMGYLLTGVRGLGLMISTWATVVLLGGLVTMMPNKDFWCLSAITLIQIARVFDFLLKEKASDGAECLKGLLVGVGAAVVRPFKKDRDMSGSKKDHIGKEAFSASMMLALLLCLVQLLVIVIVLCPVALMFVIGLYTSAGISLWRLIKHDYSTKASEGAHLKTALSILYSLALAQGVVNAYRDMYYWVARTGLVKKVSNDYSLGKDLVSDYLEETVTGCVKDPSFAKGRNLITYAVGMLMEPKSRCGYIAGVMILGTTLQPNKWTARQSGLIKVLLVRSTAFDHVVERLVETFGSTSFYSTEIRLCAARVVANVAGDIRLSRFPQGVLIQPIFALLDSFEEYSWRPEGHDRDSGLPKGCERDWLLEEQEREYLKKSDGLPEPSAADSSDGYKRLVVQGLCILRKLTINEDNCRVIRESRGQLKKTTEHLTSVEFHDHDHDDWSIIARQSLELMKRLMATLDPGETKTELPGEISSIREVIIWALKRTLECPKCDVQLKAQAVELLLDLSVETSSIVSHEGSEMVFSCVLLHIYLLPSDYLFDSMCGSIQWAKKSSGFRRLAGERLLTLLPGQDDIVASDTNMFKAVSVAADNLIRLINGPDSPGPEFKGYRTHAVTILRHLCRHYTKDDVYLREVIRVMTCVIPKVLKEIVSWLLTGDWIPAANLDLEQGTVSYGSGEPSADDIKLQEALIDLCMTIYNSRYMSIYEGLTLSHSFDRICHEQGMPVQRFISSLKKACDKLQKEKPEQVV